MADRDVQIGAGCNACNNVESQQLLVLSLLRRDSTWKRNRQVLAGAEPDI
jgi:hypothetical protein